MTSNSFCHASASIVNAVVVAVYDDGGVGFFFLCFARFQCLSDGALCMFRCYPTGLCSARVALGVYVCLLPTSYHINVMLIFSVVFSYYSQSSQNPGSKLLIETVFFFLLFPFIAMGYEFAVDAAVAVFTRTAVVGIAAATVAIVVVNVIVVVEF